ncbi:helix-turn-helix domain-containing protein [Parabacteroides chinchillae]|uniref:AraC-type DNA-binding protein n=1 Tax=Parabacteroides chinchillae TaxID=871327 RepID=A0A8G2FA96_9BACT|nr:helix-turn-helix domain-containing protein [Parabacteroides chinchillae]SEF72596.1 AraC-type DNA-binding protein [Parabacteroides chinchillae]
MKQPLLFCFILLTTQFSIGFFQNNNKLTLEYIYNQTILASEKAVTHADTAELQDQSRLFIISAYIIILLLLLTWLTYRNSQIVRHKNKIIANLTDQLISCRDQLQQARETIKELSQSNIKSPVKEIVSITNEPADSDLFATLQEIIVKEKLFLQPDLTREYLLKRIKTDKNRFARMLQENANSNFNSYINDMRLEYSMLLMKQYPHHTIQAIAQDSGISNVRTYHRLFKEKMGMTPAEYKAAL